MNASQSDIWRPRVAHLLTSPVTKLLTPHTTTTDRKVRHQIAHCHFCPYRCSSLQLAPVLNILDKIWAGGSPVPTGNGELAKSEFPSYWPMDNYGFCDWWQIVNFSGAEQFQIFYRQNNNCINGKRMLIYKVKPASMGNMMLEKNCWQFVCRLAFPSPPPPLK